MILIGRMFYLYICFQFITSWHSTVLLLFKESSSVTGGFYNFLRYKNISEGCYSLCSRTLARSGRRNLVRCDLLQLCTVCSCLLLCKLMWKTSDTLFFPSWVKTMQKSTTDSHAKCHLSASEKVRKPLLGANKQKYGQPHESWKQIKPKTWETHSMVTAKEQVFENPSFWLWLWHFVWFFCGVLDLLLPG